MEFTSPIGPMIPQNRRFLQVCSVMIYDAEMRFVNEIPVRTTLAGVQYADQLATENPRRLYVVRDEANQEVYKR